MPSDNSEASSAESEAPKEQRPPRRRRLRYRSKETVSTSFQPDPNEDNQSPTPQPSISESVNVIWTTIKTVQTQLQVTNPQAARIMEGIFVILQTVIDIDNNAST